MENLTIKAFLRGAQIALVAALAWAVSFNSSAQLTGYSVELDTMLWETEAGDPLEDYAYYGVYSVYANFTNTTDALSAVFASNVDTLLTPPMGIDAPCGCVNPANTSIAVDASNNPAFWELSRILNTIHSGPSAWRPGKTKVSCQRPLVWATHRPFAQA